MTEYTEFDRFSPDIQDRLFETLGALRENCPVSHSDQGGGYWALTRYGDIVTAARDYKRFTTTLGVTVPRTNGELPALPLEVDPPEHTRYRRILQPAFTPNAIAAWEDQVRKIVCDAFDSIVPQGNADLIESVAQVVPPAVIALVLGLDPADAPKFMAFTDTLHYTALSGDHQTHQKTEEEFEEYLWSEIGKKRQNPDDSALSVIANNPIEGEPLTRAEILGLTHVLVVAGHDTAINAIGSICWYIATVPGLKQTLVDDADLIPVAVEESLRLQAPAVLMARTTVEDVELSGVEIPKGEKVLLVFASANRDGSVFEQPDEFVCPREKNPHVAFGSGNHLCQGAPLARLELRIVVEELLRRIPDYEVVPNFEPRWKSGGPTRGLVSLPVSFSPVVATARA